MLLHLIADFGPNDLAFAEVAQRLKLHLPEAETVLTTVPPFATLAAGLCAAQLGLNDAPPGTLLFHNVAPRRDDRAARTDNDGERLAYARLPNGVQVVGVNAGYAFSFLKDVAFGDGVTELRFVNAPSAGSQFRSRDLFPQAFAAVVRGEDGALAEAVQPQQVPDVPDNRLAYIDGFGNLKTTCRFGERSPGTRLQITLNGVERHAVCTDGSFSVPQGELAFSKGSSGWATSRGEVRFMELFLRGGSAWETFGRPAVGDKLQVANEPRSA